MLRVSDALLALDLDLAMAAQMAALDDEDLDAAFEGTTDGSMAMGLLAYLLARLNG